MKIAVVGTGIAGMVASWQLHRQHELVVYEAGPWIGGHTNTVDLGPEHGGLAVDTGFIVFNDWTYPNFIRILNELGVESQPSRMSFSVREEARDFEYNGTSVNSLFAQRRNLIRPSFLLMIRDILRFNREALELLASDSSHASPLSLGQWLRTKKFGREFVEHYIVPMGAAVWSTGERGMEEFPARYFAEFFRNHGFLSVDDRPVWRVVKGGSARYVERITKGWREHIRLKTPVVEIKRFSDKVMVRAQGKEPEIFDHVVLACHMDDALRLLSDASPLEREILATFDCTDNVATLHIDASLMPRRKLAWAAWNHLIRRSEARGTEGEKNHPVVPSKVALTYSMNILQSLPGPREYFVSLNSDDLIAQDSVLARFNYRHPFYTPATVAAQKRWHEISRLDRRTHFCGAGWGYGFHEDGVRSGLAVARTFGLGWKELPYPKGPGALLAAMSNESKS
jgi:predicted NAD/FAD-binding protein